MYYDLKKAEKTSESLKNDNHRSMHIKAVRLLSIIILIDNSIFQKRISKVEGTL